MMINDPKVEKERLLENSERYKEDFENEFHELTGKVERGIITGLVIGGLAYVTYRLIRNFAKSDEEPADEVENEKPKTKSTGDNSLAKVTQYVTQTIALILINLAKEKLLEYLNERKQLEETDSPSNSQQEEEQ